LRSAPPYCMKTLYEEEKIFLVLRVMDYHGPQHLTESPINYLGLATDLRVTSGKKEQFGSKLPPQCPPKMA